MRSLLGGLLLFALAACVAAGAWTLVRATPTSDVYDGGQP